MKTIESEQLQVQRKRILGIVAEYDPFHRGHERHLRMACERVQPDFTWVAMSGCWKQRGELAMFSPYDRARCALEAGADAVFLLPAAWTVRDAGHYATGAVSLLAGLGATHLAFGAETDNLSEMLEAARMLEQSREEFEQQLRSGLDCGWGYPKALACAGEKVRKGLKDLLNQPNNVLGICYLRAMMRIHEEMIPVLIPRNGSYREETIVAEAPSASAIRSAIRRGNYREAYRAVPEYSEQVIRKAVSESRIPDEAKLDVLMIHRLRSMTREEIGFVKDVSEGLENRIYRAARICKTREQLLQSVSTSRYPKARISRICAWTLLDHNRTGTDSPERIHETVLLGMKKSADMTRLWKNSRVRIFTSMKETEGEPLWQADLCGWNLWNLCSGRAADDFYRQKMLIL